jgi:DNA-binding IclR family transcriptional regulator
MEFNRRRKSRNRPRGSATMGDDMAPKPKAAAPPENETADGGDPLRGMDRSFAVLELIAAQPARIVDITKLLGLPWATVHRTMTQLERAQFLRKDPETNRFEIGPRLWHIGSAYLSNHRVLNAALSYLSQSQDIEGIAVQICERVGNQAVAIHSAQRLAEDITKAHFGFHFPLHCGSKGQVLLAYEDAAVVDAYLKRPLEKLTNETVTEPARLRTILGDIRRKLIPETDSQNWFYVFRSS